VRKRAFPGIVFAAALIMGGALSADDFYQGRLLTGQQEYRSGRYAEAADNLRVASFGLLNRPRLLSESLVWLALAQSKANRP